VTAYYLKVWLEDELDYLGECPWEEDLEFARAVCGKFRVELRVVSLQLEYYEKVVSYALEELRAGRTPSPDIFCNERIKFGSFLEFLDRSEDGPFDRIASGHYARIRERDGRIELLRAPDPVKDQSYFLSHLHQNQLQQLVFPIGRYMKARVRDLAQEYDLPNKNRPDSQGICFLGKIRYPEFIRHYLGERTGAIVELETGTELGSHRGYWFYTIGQRTGLGLAGGPWYVVRKDTDANTVYVSHGREDRARDSFRAGELSWIGEPASAGRYEVKLRHGPTLIPARIEYSSGSEMQVRMDRPDGGVAPGQFVVVYDGEVCLGSGKILEDR
jgi:tRNA-specific 2-thiouridylase